MTGLCPIVTGFSFVDAIVASERRAAPLMRSLSDSRITPSGWRFSTQGAVHSSFLQTNQNSWQIQVFPRLREKGGFPGRDAAGCAKRQDGGWFQRVAGRLSGTLNLSAGAFPGACNGECERIGMSFSLQIEDFPAAPGLRDSYSRQESAWAGP
jgi:hypothetical protein